METIKTICDGIGKAQKSWQRYKNAGAPASPSQFLDAANLDQQVGKAIIRQSGELNKTMEKVYGKNGLSKNVSKGLTEQPPTSKLKRVVRWNESRSSTPGGLPGGGEKVANKFSIQANFLRIAGAAIGIGVTICMTMQ
jgi:hypothetical protein